MIQLKLNEIKAFCEANANPEVVEKYSKYFKDGYQGYGIKKEVFENQIDLWIKSWSKEMSLDEYLDLGDLLMKDSMLEEISIAIHFVGSCRDDFSETTFDRIGRWFELGIDNWASTDVLCMLVLPYYLIDGKISYSTLAQWRNADSEWQRRAVPVTLNQLIKHDLNIETVIPILEPMMLDDSDYVQKGIGTLLRSFWKKNPEGVEHFLMKWKDQCGRKIVQYATEKMTVEYRA